MMLRIEAGDSPNRLDLKSAREETGLPVSTWTRMISFRIVRLRLSSAMGLVIVVLLVGGREGEPLAISPPEC